MNILLISPYFSPMVGGVETHLDDLCIFLNKQKYTVFVRTYKAFGVKFRGMSSEEKGYIHIHRLWWPDINLIFKLEPYPILKFFYLFIGLFLDCLIFSIKKYKSIDVIQAHGFIAAMIGVFLGKLFKKKVVINTHVDFSLSKGFMTEIIKIMLRSSDRILVLTSGIKESLVNLGISVNKVDIYHYWVNQKLFSKVKSARKKLGLSNEFIVLFVGRLVEEKGIKIIFNIAKKLKQITFVIVGLGPLDKNIRKISKEFKNIIFLGKINNNKLPLYYSASDIVLIPTLLNNREYNEGIPRVMIEALSCGTPVVSTKSGSIPHIFSDKIGILVEDKLSLIEEVIEEYYQNQKKLKDISRNCRIFALKHFSEKNAQIIKNSLRRKK